jgi:AbrB family looped-hinge helix DNA binding protein
MSNTVKYIKSFSNGQVTIPKDIRDNLGIGKDFWLKISVAGGKIIAEPTEGKQNKAQYKESLLAIHTVVDLASQIASVREQNEQQIVKRVL